MPKKLIQFGTKSRKSLQSGITTVVDAVKTSYGPSGRNTVIELENGSPDITNDGVTIAKAVELEGFEQMGVRMIIEAANKTNDIAGDGTSVTTILAGALIQGGMRVVEAGSDPIRVRDGIEAAAKTALSILDAESQEITTLEEMASVASISCRNKELGMIIAEVVQKVGKDGVVTVSDGRLSEVEVDIAEGMQFDKGYSSPYFITNKERMESVLDTPAVLITEHQIKKISQVVPIVDALSKDGRKDLFIVAPDISSDIMSTFILNKSSGQFNVHAVLAPSFGDRQNDMLSDMAYLTGASVVKGSSLLEDATLEDLGEADKVVSNKKSTTIIGGQGRKEDIEDRVEELRREIANEANIYEKEGLEERLARLTGGVAIIKAGAATETRMKELRYQIEDAVNATQAAVAEGVVPGGASTLIRISEDLSNLVMPDPQEQAGVDIFREALLAPFRAMASNSGEYDVSIFIDKIKSSPRKGYNFKTKEYEDDMVQAGVVDPTMVLREAIKNSLSVASSIITTEVVMVREPENETKENPFGFTGDFA